VARPQSLFGSTRRDELVLPPGMTLIGSTREQSKLLRKAAETLSWLTLRGGRKRIYVLSGASKVGG